MSLVVNHARTDVTNVALPPTHGKKEITMKLLACVAVAATIAMPALAEKCGPSLFALQQLQGRYGESVVDTYSNEVNGIPTQWFIWHNAKAQTWSITATQGPTTCLMAAGNGAAPEMADFVIGAPRGA